VNEAERKGDFWIFGGIFRPVYLEALPTQHIERVALDADAKGVFKANVYLKNAKVSQLISAQIYTLDGKKIGLPIQQKVSKENEIVGLKNK